MADQGTSRQDIWASEAALTLLGPLRLVGKAGDDLTPKARKTRALLAVVALSKGPVPRSRLIDLLWGDRGEDQAKASLRQALYELRDLSNAGLLTVNRELVDVGPKRLWTDVGEIDAASDPAQIADRLQDVQWPAIGDLDDITPELDEWVRSERVRLAAAILQKGADSAQQALGSGDAASARRIADCLEQIDPLDERGAQAGARADIALGDRAAAHRRIDRLEKRLQEELGLDPSPETRALLSESPEPKLRRPTGAKGTRQAGQHRSRRWLFPALAAGVLLIAAVVFLLLRPAALEARPSIAVLPFEDVGQKTQNYFATGVSDEILNLLSHEQRIRVLGRVSADEIAHRQNTLETARQLGITHLLDGSVRTAGNRVLVIVTLTRVSDGGQMWSEKYERQLGDIFAVQGEIAKTVASRLAQSFGVTSNQPTTPDVYDRYLAARQLVRERREVPLKEAEGLLRQAIALDPGYAPAYAELSQVQMLLSDHPTNYGSRPLKEARAEAARLARKAIQLDPNLGDAYAAMGLLNIYDESSLPYYRKAVELSPQRSDYHRWLGQVLWISNRFDEGLGEYRRAVDLDPLWGLNYDHLTGALLFLGRNDEAHALLRRFLALSRDDRAKIQLLRSFANAENRLADNLRYSQTLYKRFGDERLMQFYLANALGWLGEPIAASRYTAFDPMTTAILDGDNSRFVAEAKALGPDFWDRANFWGSARILLLMGHSRDLVALYDQSRPDIQARHLDEDTVAIPELILALRQAGRTKEADHLLSVYSRNTSQLPRKGIGGAIRAVNQATIDALSGRDDEAARRIDQLSRSSPLSLNFVPSISLLDNPLFAALRDDPRLAAADERVRTALNLERRKAGLAPISREAWATSARTLLTKN
jgi:TolB-like protein/DNA-binding SARP family transcriptional activator/Tfp pilus assembly protein PilF